MKMHLSELFEQLESKLIHNDKLLAEIDARRDSLNSLRHDEEEKISSYSEELQKRITNAALNLKKKLDIEMKNVDEKLREKREELRIDSRLLCGELDRLNGLAAENAVEDMRMSDNLDELKNILTKSYEKDILEAVKPSFHTSKTLSKFKTSCFGYLNVAEFTPEDFMLSLSVPLSNCVSINPRLPLKVVCRVTTEHEFTENIQANIKFSIKKKGLKEAIPIIREDSKLDTERKSFTIAFLMQDPGIYSVNVLLYDQHVSDSPLTIVAPELVLEDAENNKDTSEVDQSVKGISYHDEVMNLDVSLSKVEIGSALRKPRSNNSTKENDIKGVKVEPKGSGYYDQPSFKEPVIGKPTNTVTDLDQVGLSTSPLPEGPLDLSCIKPGGYLKGECMLSIDSGLKTENLNKSIGMCMLKNGSIAIASTFDDKVKIFSNDGRFIKEVNSPNSFVRPSDMVTLHCGNFAVRDNIRVQVFGSDGSFVKVLLQNKSKDQYYGLAQDDEGRLLTLIESRSPASTYLVFIDIESGEVCKKVELGDPNANKRASKCRFLTYYAGNIYITDLGLNYIYILDPVTLSMKSFGSTGSSPGQFSDPAGLVVDMKGNMIIADSRNHRLCLFSKYGQFICNLDLKPEARRPSGVVLDRENKELYVLLLHGKAAMIKYKLM